MPLGAHRGKYKDLIDVAHGGHFLENCRLTGRLGFNGVLTGVARDLPAVVAVGYHSEFGI